MVLGMPHFALSKTWIRRRDEEPKQQSPLKPHSLTTSLKAKKGGWENGVNGQKENDFSTMTVALNEPKTEEINKLASTLWKAFNGIGQKEQPDECTT